MTASPHRTAQALKARSQKTEASLLRIKRAVDQLAKSGSPVTVAAVARQADVSRTFLYEHTEARTIVTQATLRARGLRAQTDQAQRDAVEASWRERALRRHLIWFGRLLVVVSIVERLVPDELWELFQRV
ncbi:DUF6262 family protein, partial [Streptomyces canus]|uniref:DUF6262 family protein n=1 Tax=Streptomyces canus TaxID=58343 RepID=UPI0037F4FC87